MSGGFSSASCALPHIKAAMWTALRNCIIAAPGEGGNERNKLIFFEESRSKRTSSRSFWGLSTPYTDKVNSVTLSIFSYSAEANYLLEQIHNIGTQ